MSTHQITNLLLALFDIHNNQSPSIALDQLLLNHLTPQKEIQLAGGEEPKEKQQQRQVLRRDMRIFGEELANMCDYWIDILQNKNFAKGTRIMINSKQFICEMRNKLISMTVARISKCSQVQINEKQFATKYISCANVQQHFTNLIIKQSKKFKECFSYGDNFMTYQVKIVENMLETSTIINTYILFGVLKQIKLLVDNEVRLKLKEVYGDLNKVIVDKFCRFVLNFYEFIDIVWEDQSKAKKQQNLIKLNTSTSNVSKGQDKPIDVAPSWDILGVSTSMKQGFKTFAQTCKSMIVGRTDRVIQNDIMMEVSGPAVSAGSLGKVLVDINKYENAGDFFRDLSKSTIIGGSINVMLQQIPILNYFIVAGGLSFVVYKNYKDEILNSQSKFKRVGKASLMATGFVGTTMTGVALGSILIPVPFLGAFIGGVFGGYLGEKGTRELSCILQSKETLEIICYLKKYEIDKSHWLFSEQMLEKMGISEKYFDDIYCPNIEKRNIYITILCFYVVTNYESKRQQKETQIKLNQSNQKTKNKDKPSKADLVEQTDKDSFKTEFEIVKILDYLTEKKVFLLDVLPDMQKILMAIS